MKNFFKFKPELGFCIYNVTFFCMLYAACAHILYAIIYFLTDFYLLGIHSILANILYLVCIYLFNEERIRPLFIAINIELLSFVILNASTFDWGFSFHLYIFIIIPLIVISSSSSKLKKYNIKVAIIQFIILALTIFITKLYTVYYPNSTKYELNDKLFDIYDILSVFTFANAIGAAFMLLLAFVTDLNLTQEALLHASTHDPLTNLINRGGMKDKFENAIAQFQENSSKFSVIIADLDNFKTINDTYGHNTGDDVLKLVSSTILKHVDTKDYVCRWGGEEILILTQSDINISSKLAEKLRINIENLAIKSNNTTVNITATFGVAEFTKNMSLSDIISKADNNLYIGKTSTKNCVIS